jgi:Tol biopolymer transport system component
MVALGAGLLNSDVTSKDRTGISNDFEGEGLKTWAGRWEVIPSAAGKGVVEMDSKAFHSAPYSLKITPNKNNTYEGFGVFKALDVASLQGMEVTVSAYAKAVGLEDDAAAGILLKTDKQNWVVIPRVEDGDFVRVDKSFIISDSIPEAVLLVLVNSKKGKVWIDDLDVSVGDTGDVRRDALVVDEGTYVDRINTPGWQDSGFISPDGTELYFAYSPYAQKDFLDIARGKISEKDVESRGPIREGSHGPLILETYKSVRKADGMWGRPTGININTNYSLASAKLSFDGSELFYSIRDYPENIGPADIYVSKKLEDGNWGPPVNLGPNVNSRYLDDTPCVTADGNTLYFARNRFGEALGWEIMVSKRVDGTWTKSEPLPPPINEKNVERSANHQPFVTADGKELYFTRVVNLYRSFLQADGSWGKPEKIYNRFAGHASVTADGRWLYFIAFKDKKAKDRHNFTIWYAERQKDGSWGEPVPVD